MSQWEIITDRGDSRRQKWAARLGEGMGERLSGNTWIYFDVAQPSIFGGYSSENKNISSGICPYICTI